MAMMWCLVLLSVFGGATGENACDVCHCTNDVVVCSDRGLTAIPDKIPTTAVTLLLDRNSFGTVPDMKFAKLQRLQKLDLSNNLIENLAKRSFNGLGNLFELNLASNKLMYNPERFPKILFMPMKKLKKLWLNDNHPKSNSTYPDQALKHLRMLEELHIDGLPSPFGPGFRSLSRLKKLYLSDDSCDMQKLKNSTFEHVPHITHLNVSNCEILDTEASTFSPLKRIYDLDISDNNRLGFKKVSKALQGLSGSPISVLRLNKLYGITDCCSKLTNNLVDHLENTNLTELYVDSNGIIDMEPGAVMTLPKTLQVLSMRDNRFFFSPRWFSLKFMPSLRYLDISDLNEWHPIGTDESSFENKTGFQSENGIPVPSNLETLVLSRCYFRGGVFGVFINKNSLKRISADHGLLSFIQGAIHGLLVLEYLDLSHNVLENVTIDAFSALPCLKSLNVSNNKIGQVIRSDAEGDLFGKLKNLEILKLGNNDINMLPYSIFIGLRDVRIIDVSQNELEEFDVEMAHLRKLKYLNLADNKIRYLPSEIRKYLDNVTLNLKSNPLSCTCEHLDFLHWMSARLNFIEDLTKTQCQYFNSTKVSLYFFNNTLNYLDNHCRDYQDMFMISLCLFLMIIFLMISLIVYQFRWRLRRLYYLGPKGPRYNLDVNHLDYVYDAFVCYADVDRSFVINDMISELEKKAGLKLCIHDRDFIPGTVIASNIVNAIQNSRKTIVVLSPSFLQSDWCNYEFNMAETEGVARRENVVVAIMYRPVDFSKMPKNMSAMFIKYSFLKYNIAGHDNQIFWSNICDGIRTPESE